MSTGEGPGCGAWIGVEDRYCCSAEGLRRYRTGLRCPLHTPAAEAGRPESPEGPGWPTAAWSAPSPLSSSAVIDERAVASGKRRSSPSTYRAAQAAIKARKDSSDGHQQQ
ncbi:MULTISPECIES: hypothetical protein [Streptomyces]|uniref:hypothetical protein n=1 Tax=Streptomyces lycopersici TaxID=2974589 RepID=UPI0021D275E9|nr:hypothetical protein [Streptomyces sp. NEAU-383]